MIQNEELKKIRDNIASSQTTPVKAWQIKEHLVNQGEMLDESTIRGRFCAMGEPLGARTVQSPAQDQAQAQAQTQSSPPKPQSKKIDIIQGVKVVAEHLKGFIPPAGEFASYIERGIDKRLALHYDSSRIGNWKYPITQGKQGTGKTMGHMYYAYKKQVPFFLFSCYEDFRLNKLFGDKTIVNGTIEFAESVFVQAIQGPCVCLFDEVNYVSNENSVDFHALLQNRELFVKDADRGKGKVYKLHDDCKIGFAQNPKSAKYIGGNVKPSNFLGRCTYITYPEFSKKDIKKAVATRFSNLVDDDVNKFIEFYFACTKAIENANIPVDISIRQLNNVIDLYNHGATLNEAIEDGLISIMDAASQSKNKESFTVLAKGIWKEMMNRNIDAKVGSFGNFLSQWR